MRASKLVNLGSMILMLGVGAGALAEEAAVVPVETPAVAEAGALSRALHLAAVGQKGARERIRAEAARLGLVEGENLLAVA